MNLLMLDLVDRFYALIWPLLRISAFMGFASIFSIRAVNLRLRILISFGLTVFISMQIDIPKLDPVTVLGLKEIFNQIFIGFSMAMVMQLATAALVIAGQALSGSMGLTMANLIDPTLGNVPVLSQFFTLLGTLVFLAIGGHLIVFGILLESFQQFPIGQSLMTQEFMGKMISWSAMMFVASLLISLPVLITLLFVNIGLGFVTRAAPSLNIFSVGFPAMVLSGFLVLWLALPNVIGRINWLWVQTFNQLRSLLLT
ncbi:MAG: flagellar biosynthetic protein FliR [Limnohabitans sp.]|jgi:flagellar biosynthetic protein FliR|nr:flagellar biosynthetic protein FliR [Limnohabitans sp.]